MEGRTISHYRILEKIGEGGMVVVHKAEDTKLHRTAALKFLRPDSVEDEELTTRFRHEAEAARRRIRHAKAICRRELGATREPTRSSAIGSE